MGGLIEAGAKGRKHAAEQLVRIKSFMKNMHNKNTFQGQTCAKGGSNPMLWGPGGANKTHWMQLLGEMPS